MRTGTSIFLQLYSSILTRATTIRAISSFPARTAIHFTVFKVLYRKWELIWELRAVCSMLSRSLSFSIFSRISLSTSDTMVLKLKASSDKSLSFGVSTFVEKSPRLTRLILLMRLVTGFTMPADRLEARRAADTIQAPTTAAHTLRNRSSSCLSIRPLLI